MNKWKIVAHKKFMEFCYWLEMRQRLKHRTSNRRICEESEPKKKLQKILIHELDGE